MMDADQFIRNNIVTIYKYGFNGHEYEYMPTQDYNLALTNDPNSKLYCYIFVLQVFQFFAPS